MKYKVCNRTTRGMEMFIVFMLLVVNKLSDIFLDALSLFVGLFSLGPALTITLISYSTGPVVFTDHVLSR